MAEECLVLFSEQQQKIGKDMITTNARDMQEAYLIADDIPKPISRQDEAIVLILNVVFLMHKLKFYLRV